MVFVAKPTDMYILIVLKVFEVYEHVNVVLILKMQSGQTYYRTSAGM